MSTTRKRNLVLYLLKHEIGINNQIAGIMTKDKFYTEFINQFLLSVTPLKGTVETMEAYHATTNRC